MGSVNKDAYCDTFEQAKYLFDNFQTFCHDDSSVISYALIKTGRFDSTSLTLNEEHFSSDFDINSAALWANFLQVIPFPKEIMTSTEAKQHFRESVLVNSYYKQKFNMFFSKENAELFLEYFIAFAFFLQNSRKIYKPVIKEMKVVDVGFLKSQYPEVYYMFNVVNDELYSVLIRYEILIDDRITVELQELLPDLMNKSSSYRIYSLDGSGTM